MQTGKSILVVKSITYAMRGQQLLNNYNISAYVVRNLDVAKRYGCGYSLRLRSDCAKKATEILLENGIRVVDLFLEEGAEA